MYHKKSKSDLLNSLVIISYLISICLICKMCVTIFINDRSYTAITHTRTRTQTHTHIYIKFPIELNVFIIFKNTSCRKKGPSSQ